MHYMCKSLRFLAGSEKKNSDIFPDKLLAADFTPATMTDFLNRTSLTMILRP